MIDTNWQPTAAIKTLRERAALLSQIRSFFLDRNVMEVDTQILSQAAVSDPFIDSIEAHFSVSPNDQKPQSLYMQTSPEYAMKRLLAAGSGCIFQLGKAFRNGEQGRFHNPEFTMLEWYREGFSSEQLMDEVELLVRQVLGCAQILRLSYRELFLNHLGIDPHTADLKVLQTLVREHIDAPFEDMRKDTWLELAMAEVIEPELQEATFVYDFPASQASLSKLRRDQKGVEVATRFELYIGGMEIANGYQELTDSAEQQQRLNADLQLRASLGLPVRPVEMRLVAALAAGIPECSGVALGVDRLLMLKVGTERISDVIPFAFDRA